MRLPSLCEKEVSFERNPNDKSGFILKDDSGAELLQFYLRDNKFECNNSNIISSQDIEEIVFQVQSLIKSESIGIEDESEGDNDRTVPFDPKDIALSTKVVTMDTLLRRIEQGTINLNPDFQRREVWNMERKSRLIESLILRIPIPMFYVSSDADDIWTVVDGLQRISTIRDFVLGQKYLKSRNNIDKGHGFLLQNLEFWTDYNDCDLIKLPPKLYNRIMETEFSFTLINPPTPEEVKLNVFKRINTGGMQLSPQEIRNALYTGPSTILLNELTSMTSFIKATDRSIHADRMQDKELALRFVSFLVRDYTSYKKTMTSDLWLSQTMILINDFGNYHDSRFKEYAKRNNMPLEGLTGISPDKIKSQFNLSMERALKLFGTHAFRKSYGDKKRSPINKSLFEVWGVILQMLSTDEFGNLLKRKESFLEEYCQYLENASFMIAISRDSMKWQSVQKRYNELIALTLKYIKSQTN